MPTLIDTIICENIRQEANNKLSLLGVFGDEVLVRQFPYQFPALAVFQRWSLSDQEYQLGAIVCRVELRPPQGDPVILPDNPLTLNPTAAHSIAIAIQIGGFTIPAEGSVSVVTFFDNREAHVHRFRVRVPSRNEIDQLHLAGF